MDIKVSIDAMSSEEFLKLFERVSKSIIFYGCRTEECINERIKEALKYRKEQYKKATTGAEIKEIRKSITNLKTLLKFGFAFRTIIEAWTEPNSIYIEKLGFTDEECKELFKEKKESDKRLSGILEYERHLKSERLKKKKKAK